MYLTKTARVICGYGYRGFVVVKMLKLREELLVVEEDRLAGRVGVMPDELDKYLEEIIAEVEHEKETSI